MQIVISVRTLAIVHHSEEIKGSSQYCCWGSLNSSQSENFDVISARQHTRRDRKGQKHSSQVKPENEKSHRKMRTRGGVSPPRMQYVANAKETEHGAHSVPSLGELVFEINSVEHELTETLNRM